MGRSKVQKGRGSRMRERRASGKGRVRADNVEWASVLSTQRSALGNSGHRVGRTQPGKGRNPPRLVDITRDV
jgi:hypothetical protein